VSVSTT